MIFCTLFSALGQVFYKLASRTFEFSVFGLITNYMLLLGLVFYFIGGILLVLALKKEMLSSVYPLIALTFVWVFIIGVLAFDESINVIKILGTIMIVTGVGLIGGS